VAKTIPPTATPYNTFVPISTSQPLPTLPPEDELSSTILHCLTGGPVTAPEAAAQLPDCMTSGTYTVTAEEANGTPATVLIDVKSDCFQSTSLIAWQDNGWHVQPATPFLQLDSGTYFNGYANGVTGPPSDGPNPLPRARLVETNGVTYLGIPHLNAGCGSGPQDRYILLRLDGDSWQLTWDSGTDQRTLFGHTVIYFGGDGIDTLHIDGDSWSRQDEMANVFHESNPGPHRYFQQTWERQSDSYQLASETVTPSPYNTLVNFVYDIGVGDIGAAGPLVTDPTLIQTAIDLGLTKDPAAPQWSGICGDGGPRSGPPCNIGAPDGRSWQVDMVQSGDSWLVSGVGPAPSAVPASSIP
jgi:hypothetical protein